MVDVLNNVQGHGLHVFGLNNRPPMLQDDL